jgi:hypothetical protein
MFVTGHYFEPGVLRVAVPVSCVSVHLRKELLALSSQSAVCIIILFFFQVISHVCLRYRS